LWKIKSALILLMHGTNMKNKIFSLDSLEQNPRSEN
jgi:hypothetical protein